jgi:hypothetical protein
MDIVKLHPKFIMHQLDLEYLASLPPNMPGRPLIVEHKKRVDVVYRKYVTRNGLVGANGAELYTIAAAKKWLDKTHIVDAAAKRIVLNEIVALQKFQEITVYDLARRYRSALLLDPMQRIVLHAAYDF